MAMGVTQVRIPEGVLRKVDELVEKGFYSSKSDVIRDAVRKLILEKQVGSLPGKGDSVRETRKVREKIRDADLDEINSLE